MTLFAGADGAGIFNQGTMTLVNTTVTTNRANQNGGGILNSGTVMTAKNVAGFELMTKKLEKGKTYFWNVKTCNSAGCAKSAWSKFAVTP